MRLTKEQLFEITNRRRISGQVRWFKDFLKIDVPCDRLGPIVTEAAYQDLVKKRLGVLPEVQTQYSNREQPKVRLIHQQS